MKSIRFILYIYVCGNHQSWTGRCLEMGILELFLFYYLCYIDWEYDVLCCV